ncbi:MAG: hypothetical protein KJ044_08325, partial [Planctomycetes bacterium]|nr:hypothetical protein [Planctomycetota bacterium]
MRFPLFAAVLLAALFVASSLEAQAFTILGPGANNPLAANVAPGTNNHSCIQFQLVRNTGSTTLTQVVAGNNGTATSSDYTQARLYHDVNANGVFDAGDTQLSSASGSFPLTFAIASTVTIDTTAKAFIIVVDVATGATAGRTFTLTVATTGITVAAGTVQGVTVTGGAQTVSGAATVGPEIDVQRPAGTSIPSGMGSIDNVGALPIGTGTGVTWTIANTGTTDLTLTGTPPVALSNDFGLSSVSVTTQPTTPISGPSGSTTFTITINPSAANWGFRITNPNNDSNENPYIFNVTGTGTSTSATQLVVTTQPGNGTGGLPLNPQPVVEARNPGGTVDTSFNGVVTAAITTGTGTTGATIVTGASVNAVNGVATFTSLAIDLAGTGYTLTFTSGALTPAVSGTFNVTVGPAAMLVVTTQPGNGTGGLPLNPQPVVQVRDAGGNLVTSSSATVNAAITSGTGTTGATIVAGGTTNASGGVATFSGLAIDLAGTGYTLTFSSTGLTNAVSGTFNVTLGPAAALRMVTQPGGAVMGAAFVTQPQVEVVDAGGNRVTSSSASVAAAITTGTGTTGATLSGTTPVNATAGLASFTNLSINLSGTGYTLSFTSTSLTGTVSAPFNVAGTPAQLGMATQPGGAVVNTPFLTQPVVEIRDSAGTVIATDNTTQVTVTIATGTGAFTGGSTTTRTAVNGVVTFTNLAIDTAGLGFSLSFADTGAT